MKNLVLKSVIFLLVVTFAGSLFAQQRQQRQPRKNMVRQQLNLTEDQQKKMQQFRLDHQEYCLDIKNKIQKNRLEVKKLMMADNLNESELIKLSNENSELRAKIKDSKLKMWLDTYKILNADQQKIWKKTFAKMGRGMAQGEKGIRRGMKHGMKKGMQRGMGRGTQMGVNCPQGN